MPHKPWSKAGNKNPLLCALMHVIWRPSVSHSILLQLFLRFPGGRRGRWALCSWPLPPPVSPFLPQSLACFIDLLESRISKVAPRLLTPLKWPHSLCPTDISVHASLGSTPTYKRLGHGRAWGLSCWPWAVSESPLPGTDLSWVSQPSSPLHSSSSQETPQLARNPGKVWILVWTPRNLETNGWSVLESGCSYKIGISCRSFENDHFFLKFTLSQFYFFCICLSSQDDEVKGLRVWFKVKASEANTVGYPHTSMPLSSLLLADLNFPWETSSASWLCAQRRWPYTQFKGRLFWTVNFINSSGPWFA